MVLVVIFVMVEGLAVVVTTEPTAVRVVGTVT